MVQAVIFDMDGLMIDSERMRGDFRKQIRHEMGIPERPELWELTMGMGNEQANEIYSQYYGKDYPTEEIRRRSWLMWEKYQAEKGVPVKPGLFPLLDTLKRNGIHTAVATSTDRESALPTLEQAGIAVRMEQMIFGDMVEHSKPYPDIFLKAAELLKLPAKGCLALEDSPNGVKAAYNAGMKVIMVPDLVQPNLEIRSLLYACVESLANVAQLLKLE